jgi:hypothetical protein
MKPSAEQQQLADVNAERTARGQVPYTTEQWLQVKAQMSKTPTSTGDALGSLTDAQRSLAEKLASGDMSPTNLGRMKDREQLMAAAVAINPNWNPQIYATKQQFLDPKGRQAINLGTVNRIVGHIGRYEKNSSELGTSPSLLTGINMTGAATATSSDAHAIGTELEKLLSGGVGTKDQVNEWKKALLSPAEYLRKAAIDEISQLMLSQYEGMNQTYKAGTGQELPISQFFNPQSVDWLKKRGVNVTENAGPTMPINSASLPVIASQDAYDQLPKGAHYLAPDGSVKVKQ